MRDQRAVRAAGRLAAEQPLEALRDGRLVPLDLPLDADPDLAGDRLVVYLDRKSVV